MTQDLANDKGKINRFSQAECAQFARDGFLVAKQLVDAETVAQLRALIADQELARIQPVEFEADVRYPGAPQHRDAPGGDTPRRLLQAYHRHDRFKRWASDLRLTQRLAQLLATDQLRLTQAHHNCVMTKCPEYSSDTGWHRDVRYWSFSDNKLVNTWLALGDEFPANGGLRVIPGSHFWRGLRASERLNTDLFLRPDHPDNQPGIATAVNVEMRRGDVLFFHAALFHSASRNHTDEKKYSIVFTYHGPDTAPQPNSKSAKYPEIQITA